VKAIAISGKGGTGKTTVAALIIRWLRDNRSKSILAVDADPSLNLGDMLGVVPAETVGAIREEMRQKAGGLPGGMTKHQFLEYKISLSLTETPDFDLIAMGRPEGPGCYCYANTLLRDILDTLSRAYAYVVIDNEAGMEHISRRTTRGMDYLFMISDATVRAVKTAGKISRLADELACDIAKRYLIINRLTGELPASVAEAIEAEDLYHLASIPEDNRLSSLDQTGEPTWSMLTGTEAYGAVDLMMAALAAEW
jgi:CO dehydrogenase maturation factor